MLVTITNRGPRGGVAAPNTGTSNVVEAPLYTLPQKENGDSIAWNSVLDKPAEDMWDFRTIPANAGTTHNVTNTSEFNTALSACARGDIISVTAGTVLTGEFVLPSKSGSGWIIIRSANHASLPAVGTRIGTANAANMFTIRSTSANGVPLTVGASASKWRIIGAIITNEHANNQQTQLVDMSQVSSAPWTTQATAPNNFVLDRCHLKGNTNGQRRGICAAGYNIAIVDSRISGILDTGIADSQDVWYYSWMRRLHVDNCYLGAATENVMGGGSDQPQLDGSYANTYPADIMITRCEITHEGSDAALVRKNLLETKNGSRVLMWGCALHAYRVDNQDAVLNVLTLNQGNSSTLAPYTLSNDITIRGNKIYDCDGYLLSITRDNGTDVTVGTRRVEFSYNVAYDYFFGGSGIGRVLHAPSCEVCPEITFRNNTILWGGHSYVMWDSGTGGTYSPDFGFRIYNNLYAHTTTYGVYPVGALNTVFGTNNWRVDHNSMIDAYDYATLGTGGTPTNSGNNTTRANVAAFQFTNTGTDDYSLAGGAPDEANGSDGRARGCQWSTLSTNTSGVVTG